MKRSCLFAVVTGGWLVFAGCDHADHSHSHDEHAVQTAQVTRWTDAYEVFAEHRVPAAGTPVAFTTHVTDLRTRAPQVEGEMRIVARLGETEIEHVEPAPTRPGIYLPELTFPKAGDWNVTVFPKPGTAVELGTVRVYEDPHAADHAEVEDAPEGVALLKEQQWKLRLGSEPVGLRSLTERVRTPARVRAKPGFSSTIVAPVAGQLFRPDGVELPGLGQHVDEGRLLGVLRLNFSEAGAKIAEAQAEMAAARAELHQAETALERVRKLVAQEARSAREAQEAEMAYQIAKARHAAAAAVVGTFRQTGVDQAQGPLQMELRAPIHGVLNTVAAGPGDVVAANQPLFTILNAETVWIEAPVPEARASQLSSAGDALLELPGPAGKPVGIKESGGRLVSAGLEVDAITRTVPLVYEIPNRDGRLRVGQNVTLHVETARSVNAVAIPDSALIEEGGWYVAYVQLAGETFEKRELRLGIRDGHWVQVLDGLKEGERVVTEAAYMVRLASVSGTLPAHGHTH